MMAHLLGAFRLHSEGAHGSSVGVEARRRLLRKRCAFHCHAGYVPRKQWKRGMGGRQRGASVTVHNAADDGDPELDNQLITGDLLLLWLHSLATEAFRVSQRPDFPGWGAPLSLPPGQFSHFLTDTVTVMGFWSIAGLATGAFIIDSDSDEVTVSTALTLACSAPAIIIGLHLSHPEYGAEEVLAWGAGLATVMASWRAFVVLHMLGDESSP